MMRIYKNIGLFLVSVVFFSVFIFVYYFNKNYKDKLFAFIEQMPKVELHVHLEGSVRPSTLLVLASQNNIQLPEKTEGELVKFFKFKDFTHFCQTYNFVTKCFKTIKDYELISYEFGKACARQNIRYAEVTFSIYTNHFLTKLSWQDILKGLNAGKLRAENDFGVKLVWIFDILRDEPETQNFVLDASLAGQKNGVVGIGLTGHENSKDLSIFSKTFEIAHKNNLGVTPHAGETVGPASIWQVLKALPVDRIGHGVRCIEDEKLMKKLKKMQLPLEVCLTSNICLGIFSSYKNHPFRKLWDYGLYITINSDDPALFNTDLNKEYKLLVEYFNFDVDDLEKINLNSVYASFLPDEEKNKLAKEFKLEFKRLRKKLDL